MTRRTLHAGTLHLPTRTLRLGDAGVLTHAPRATRPAPGDPVDTFDLPVTQDRAEVYLLPDGGGLLLLLSGDLDTQAFTATPPITLAVERANVSAMDASLAATFQTRQPLELPSNYVHTSGARLRVGQDFSRFDDPIPGYAGSMNALLGTGEWTLERLPDLQARPLGDVTLCNLGYENDYQGGVLRTDAAYASTGADGEYDVFLLGPPDAPTGVFVPFSDFQCDGALLQVP